MGLRRQSRGDPPPKKQLPRRATGAAQTAENDAIEAAGYHSAEVACKLAEVARRYAWNAKQALGNIPCDRRMPSFRLRELERIFESRYGWLLPDDDAGRGDLLIALNHIANTSGDVIAKMVGWALAA